MIFEAINKIRQCQHSHPQLVVNMRLLQNQQLQAGLKFATICAGKPKVLSVEKIKTEIFGHDDKAHFQETRLQ